MPSREMREARIWGTRDNDNLPISDEVLKVASDGQLLITPFGKPTPKILGTSDPAATTNTNLFTVAASTVARITALFACNRSAVAVTIRVGIDVAGAGTNTPSDAEWLYYDLSVPANSTLLLDMAEGLYLAATDDFVVYASASDMSFVCSGINYV